MGCCSRKCIAFEGWFVGGWVREEMGEKNVCKEDMGVHQADRDVQRDDCQINLYRKSEWESRPPIIKVRGRQISRHSADLNM